MSLEESVLMDGHDVMHRTFEDRDPATGGVYFEPWTGPGDPPKGTYK